MKLSFIHAGHFKLDGGSMFGIVPKPLWEKLNPPDDRNRCTWAMRCLLIEQGDRRILVDTGMGDKQDPKWRGHFDPHGPQDLLTSLKKQGLTPEEITDVFLTHLHFDHVGGATSLDTNGKVVPTFPNAVYWSNKTHWQWAKSPNAREKGSFLKENFLPLEASGQLRFLDVPEDRSDFTWIEGIRIRPVYGHTEAMMLLLLEVGRKTFVYCADLLPSAYHIGLPYIMAYDLRPLDTLAEKERLLREALENGWYLLFEHDPENGCCELKEDPNGRIVAGTVHILESLL